MKAKAMSSEERAVGKMLGMPLPDDTPGSFRATVELLIEAGAFAFMSGTRGMSIPAIEGEPDFEVSIAGDMLEGSANLIPHGFIDHIIPFGVLWRDRNNNSIYILSDADMFNNWRKAFDFLREHPGRFDVKFRQNVLNEFARQEPVKKANDIYNTVPRSIWGSSLGRTMFVSTPGGGSAPYVVMPPKTGEPMSAMDLKG